MRRFSRVRILSKLPCATPRPLRTTNRLKEPVFSAEVARFGLFSRPRESLVEAATKGFGAPSDAFAPNFAMRRRFAAGTFARAIFYRAHEMPFGLKESPVEISVANPGAPSLFGRTRRYRSSHKR